MMSPFLSSASQILYLEDAFGSSYVIGAGRHSYLTLLRQMSRVVSIPLHILTSIPSAMTLSLFREFSIVNHS